MVHTGFNYSAHAGLVACVSTFLLIRLTLSFCLSMAMQSAI